MRAVQIEAMAIQHFWDHLRSSKVLYVDWPHTISALLRTYKSHICRLLIIQYGICTTFFDHLEKWWITLPKDGSCEELCDYEVFVVDDESWFCRHVST